MPLSYSPSQLPPSREFRAVSSKLTRRPNAPFSASCELGLVYSTFSYIRVHLCFCKSVIRKLVRRASESTEKEAKDPERPFSTLQSLSVPK